MIKDNSAQQGISTTDYLQQFHFQNTGFRGAIVKLNNSYTQALNGHDYHTAIRSLLGECLAAAVLMNTHVKKPTRLSLHARGAGPIQLLMAESVLLKPSAEQAPHSSTSAIPSTHQTVRALARYDAPLLSNCTIADAPTDLQSLLGKAQLTITMEPTSGERYQGIVGLEAAKLSDCLESYFAQSEQLPTLIKLYTSDQQAAGLLIQKIPDTGGLLKSAHSTTVNHWEEIQILAHSLTAEELLSLPTELCLHRLFHQHNYVLQPPQMIEYSCTCSPERTGLALMQIDPREIEVILNEEGEIVLDCEFCNTKYRFNRAAVHQLALNQTNTRH